MHGLPDYHTHTPLCRHATGEPWEYAQAALGAGVDELGFSDHSPMARDDFDDWRMRLDQLGAYVAGVQEARRRTPGLAIRLGLEVDWLPGCEDWVRHLSTLADWDYLIGSVHYLGDWDFDNPARIDVWRRRDTWETWQAYFRALEASARSGFFEIIGHADLCKKFLFKPDRDCRPLYDAFTDVAAQADIALELNTAGLRKPCREIYPAVDLLRLARDKGIPITFGSDAHAPSEVGADFAAAVGLARLAGYTEYARFKSRQRTLHRLPC